MSFYRVRDIKTLVSFGLLVEDSSYPGSYEGTTVQCSYPIHMEEDATGVICVGCSDTDHEGGACI
jgi:hypothetical protein